MFNAELKPSELCLGDEAIQSAVPLGLFPCSGYKLDVELGPNITCESGQVCRLLSGGGSNNLVGGPVRSNMRPGK